MVSAFLAAAFSSVEAKSIGFPLSVSMTRQYPSWRKGENRFIGCDGGSMVTGMGGGAGGADGVLGAGSGWGGLGGRPRARTASKNPCRWPLVRSILRASCMEIGGGRTGGTTGPDCGVRGGNGGAEGGGPPVGAAPGGISEKPGWRGAPWGGGGGGGGGGGAPGRGCWGGG